MKCIDLFAGAGGLSEGFRRVGFDIVAHVEMDSAAAETLKTREVYYYLSENAKISNYIEYTKGLITKKQFYDSVPKSILNKVIKSEISDDTYESIVKKLNIILNSNKVDIIIGGPPCQAYSLAGRGRNPGKMQSDNRNYLYKQYLKFIKYYKPKVFVFENVLGLLSAHGGEIFKAMQSEIEAIGYKLDFKTLCSDDFGIPQKRKRIILIGWKESIHFTYPKFEKVNNNITIKDLFSDFPFLNAGQKINFTTKNFSNNTLSQLHINNKDFPYIIQHISRPNKEKDLEIYRLCVNTWNNEKRQLLYNELPKNLRTHNNTKSYLDRFKVVPYDGISHTMVAHIAKDGHYYIHPDINQNRSISVRESARIQTFPDDYFFESSRTAAFRQIGNAVPPYMAEIIADKIKEQLF